MYIEQAFKGATSVKDYLLGLVLVFFIWSIIGSLPIIFLMNYFGLSSLKGLLDTVGLIWYFILIMFPFAPSFLTLWFIIKKNHKLSILNFTTIRSRFDWKRFFFSFSLWGGFIGLSIWTDYLVNSDDYELVFNVKFFLIQLGLSIFFIGLQATFEEFLFRGYLMQCIGVLSRRRWLSLAVTSILFGMLHGFNPEIKALGSEMFFFYISSGFLLGIITLMDDGLELSIGFHVANNLISSLLVSSDWGAIQSYAILSFQGFPKIGVVDWLVIIILYPLLIFIFSKKYNWKNWASKLFGEVAKSSDENSIS